jgi:ABC-type antimicrobial peptide transport system permease subunit
MFRSELRRRWASWLALAILVALVGGTVLAGASAARRTSSAFPDFVKKYGFDGVVFSTFPRPLSFAHLGYVEAAASSTALINGNGLAGGQLVPGNDLAVLELPRGTDSVKVVSGHLPMGLDDALVGFSMQAQYGLHIGSVITVPLYKTSERRVVFASNGVPTPHGPTLRLHVVGIEVSMLDFPSNSPNYSVYVSNALIAKLENHVLTANVQIVRLTNGAADLPRFTYTMNHVSYSGANFVYVESEDAQIAAIEGSIHPQAVGWWLFALLAALAGLALVGQALSRQSILERENYPALSALGFRPIQLFWLGMVRAAAIGVVGALGALGLAVALSPLTPVGEARAAATSSGFLFDTTVFGLGALAIVVAVLALSAYPAFRASQVRTTTRREDQPAVHGSSRIVRGLAVSGAPPSILVGSRHALERGRGRSSVPVATALVGMSVAVAALVATTVFGASLSNLLATPRLYGLGWQVDIGGFSYPQAKGVLDELVSNPSVAKVTYGINGKFVDVNGVPVQATIVDTGKGPMVFSLINGRDPSGDGEIALGTQTLAAAHAHVGSRVAVAVIGPTGKTYKSEFTVVGTVAFPPSLSPGGLGVGAVIPIHGALSALCPTGPPAAGCIAGILNQLEVPGNAAWGMAIAVEDDAAGHATALRLERRYANDLTVLTVPTNLVNFGQAVNFPLLLGATLALFGAATLAHLLFVSVVRRRREMALLKVLGFVRRQVGAAVSWQATTVATIGIVIGVPTGIALGRFVWIMFAGSLGAVPVAVVPIEQVLLVVAGVVVVGNLLAVVPALLSARLHPAEALREA